MYYVVLPAAIALFCPFPSLSFLLVPRAVGIFLYIVLKKKNNVWIANINHGGETDLHLFSHNTIPLDFTFPLLPCSCSVWSSPKERKSSHHWTDAESQLSVTVYCPVYHSPEWAGCGACCHQCASHDLWPVTQSRLANEGPRIAAKQLHQLPSQYGKRF